MRGDKRTPDEGGGSCLVQRWCCHGRRCTSSLFCILKQFPSTIIVPLVVLGALMGVGIATVLVASSAEVQRQRSKAQADVGAAAALLSQSVHDVMHPLYAVALHVQNNPSWPEVERKFAYVTQALLQKVEGISSTTYLQLAPMAKISLVHPVTNYSSLSVGLDLLEDSAIPEDLAFAARGKMTLRGPTMLYRERIWALIGGAAVFVPNVTHNETFSLPYDALGIQPSCPAWFRSACYQEATHSKLWGFIWSIIYWDSLLLGPSVMSLREKGYQYIVIQRSKELPPTPGVTDYEGHPVTVLARSDGNMGPDPVSAVVSVDNVGAFVPFTICITTAGGWQPAWMGPLIATVVVVSFIIAALLFVMLLYIRRHQMLLYALVPRKMVQSLFQADAFEAVLRSQGGTGTKDGTTMLQTGTPVEKLMDILSQLILGQTPEMRDVVSVRAAFLHRGDKLFEPQDLRGQLRLNHALEDDVINALVRELQGLTPQASMEGAMPMLFRNSTTSQAYDEHSVGRLSAALSLIVKHPTRLQDGRASCALTFGSTLGTGLCTSAGKAASGGIPHTGLHHSASCNNGCLSPPSDMGAAVCTPGIAHSAGPTVGMLLVETLMGSYPTDAFTITSASNSILQSAPDKQLAATGTISPCLPLNEQVHSILEASYGSWTFDAFALAEATDGHPLSSLLYFLFVRSGLMKNLEICPTTMARLALTLEDGYLPNPYHNKTHACDVLQTMHTILVQSGMVVGMGEKGYCPPGTLLACLLAAAGHDLGHSGVTNDFLVHSEDDLATLYSDKSPMEHHHLASLFKLLKSPSLNIIGHLPRDERTKIRKIIIELVSGTDMKNHFSILSQFSTVHRLAGDSPVVTPPAGWCNAVDATHASQPAQPVVKACMPIDDAEQMISLQMVLKCADLGHIAETLEVHCRWVECLEEEFFMQGDRERSLGLPISPLFDRTKPGASRSQIGFYDFVVLPLFHNWACVFPGAKPMVDLALQSYMHWKSKAPSPPELSHLASDSGSTPVTVNPLQKLPTQTALVQGPENA